MRRGGGGDHDVGPLELAGQRVEGARGAAEALGERDRALAAAVGHEHRASRPGRAAPGRSARRSRRRRRSRRGARRGRRARRARRRPRRRRPRRGRPRSRSRCARACRSPARRGTACWSSGRWCGRASASSYARLTWPWTSASPTIIDSRPLVDPVQVARGVAVAQRVHAPDQLGRADRGAAGEQPEHVRLGLDRVGDDEVELGAVAGGDRDGLGDARVAGQLADQRLGAAVEQRELLAQRQRRGLVRGADARAARSPRSPPRARRSRSASRRSASSASSAMSREMRESLTAMIAT